MLVQRGFVSYEEEFFLLTPFSEQCIFVDIELHSNRFLQDPEIFPGNCRVFGARFCEFSPTVLSALASLRSARAEIHSGLKLTKKCLQKRDNYLENFPAPVENDSSAAPCQQIYIFCPSICLALFRLIWQFNKCIYHSQFFARPWRLENE